MKSPYATPKVYSRPRERCLVDGCEGLEELANGRSAGGLCAAHRKRKVRSPERPDFITPIDRAKGGHLGPRQLLLEAALAYSEADADEVGAKEKTLLQRARDYSRARKRRGPSK